MSLIVGMPICETKFIFKQISKNGVNYMFGIKKITTEFSENSEEFMKHMEKNYIYRINIVTVNDSDSCIDIIFGISSYDGVIRITSEDPNVPVHKCIAVEKVVRNTSSEIWINVKEYPYGVLKSFETYFGRIILKTSVCSIVFDSRASDILIKDSNGDRDWSRGTYSIENILKQYIGCKIIEVKNGMVKSNYGKIYFKVPPSDILTLEIEQNSHRECLY